jgi:hypothetical protein
MPARHRLSRPAFENLQRRKPRGMMRGRAATAYGDLGALPSETGCRAVRAEQFARAVMSTRADTATGVQALGHSFLRRKVVNRAPAMPPNDSSPVYSTTTAPEWCRRLVSQDDPRAIGERSGNGAALRLFDCTRTPITPSP